MTHWITKEGKKIPIEDLPDWHLQFILHFLVKYALGKRTQTEMAYLFPMFGGPRGDMARDAFDNEFDAVCQMTTEDYLPDIWPALMFEAQRRNQLVKHPFDKIQIPELPDELLVVTAIVSHVATLQQKKLERAVDVRPDRHTSPDDTECLW